MDVTAARPGVGGGSPTRCAKRDAAAEAERQRMTAELEAALVVASGFADAMATHVARLAEIDSELCTMHDAIGKLAQAARSGDEGAMKAAAGDVRKACKACHDDFHAK